MNLNEFKIKVEDQKELDIRNENLIEVLKFYVLFAHIEFLSFYEFDYKYNNFNYNFSVNKNDKYELEKLKENNSFKNKGLYTLILEESNVIYGLISFSEEPKESEILNELLIKIKNILKKRFALKKEIMEQEALLDIYLINDIESSFFSNGIKENIKMLLPCKIIESKSLSKIKETIKEKIKKSIIVYVINDEKILKDDEKILKNLNEFVFVIGPNNYDVSLLCGHLNVYKYITKENFVPEVFKSFLIETQSVLLNKYLNENKILGISGISGGIGSTTIAMNSADLIAKNNKNKNVLYIDLSRTKAISNLFLGGDPLPKKTILDLLNIDDFNDLNKLIENGMTKVNDNFYAINGIQKHIDIDVMEQSIFIEKFLDFLKVANKRFNYIIIDIGQVDASVLNTTIYDIVNEMWLLTEMSLPHISKLKTFFSLIKRAGLKEKVSFLVNRYDSVNAISVNDVLSILNTSNEGSQLNFEFKIPNDYTTLGYCWNYCELVSKSHGNSLFIKKLKEYLEKKEYIIKKENDIFNDSKENNDEKEKDSLKIISFLTKLFKSKIGINKNEES
jgi:cellulose biosynthesis protein BcsQ